MVILCFVVMLGHLECPATFASAKAAGEVAEWSKAQHWKCCIGATLSRVRIPPSPFQSGLKGRIAGDERLAGNIFTIKSYSIITLESFCLILCFLKVVLLMNLFNKTRNIIAYI